jgi:hypothetical protein
MEIVMLCHAGNFVQSLASNEELKMVDYERSIPLTEAWVTTNCHAALKLMDRLAMLCNFFKPTYNSLSSSQGAELLIKHHQSVFEQFVDKMKPLLEDVKDEGLKALFALLVNPPRNPPVFSSDEEDDSEHETSRDAANNEAISQLFGASDDDDDSDCIDSHARVSVYIATCAQRDIVYNRFFKLKCFNSDGKLCSFLSFINHRKANMVVR